MQFVKKFLFCFSLLTLGMTLATPINATESGRIKDSKDFRDKIQAYLLEVAKATTDIYEISLHAMLDSGDTVRIACTNLEKLGSPSDPEDVEAIIANQVIFIHEGEVFDVTVPLLNKQGLSIAVSGIKVEHKGKISQLEARQVAIRLAKKIEQKMQLLQN